ncbi:MAG: dipeptidase [Anaerolineae bacterium]
MIRVFDGHNDVLLRYLREDGYDFFQRNESGHLDFPRAQEGGFAGGFFAIFVPNPDPMPSMSQYQTDLGIDAPLPPAIELPYAQSLVMKLTAQLYRLEAASDGQFKVVRTLDELQHCLDNNIMAAILHFEGAEMIDEKLDALEVYYQAGLRSIGPVWSRPNWFAEGVPFKFPHSPDTGPGLSDAGQALVRECNRLGILIDLSHMNEKGFWDVAKISDAPLVATHSNVHALCPFTRNLTDKQLDAIKESDGLVGVNFAVAFLREDGANNQDTLVDIILQHVDYLIDRIGEDKVAFGSDFDGAAISNDLRDVAGLPKLIDKLHETGYDESTIRKLAHENWLRVLRKTWR